MEFSHSEGEGQAPATPTEATRKFADKVLQPIGNLFFNREKGLGAVIGEHPKVTEAVIGAGVGITLFGTDWKAMAAAAVAGATTAVLGGIRERGRGE